MTISGALRQPMRPGVDLAVGLVAACLSLSVHLPGHMGRDPLVVWIDVRSGVLASPHPPAMALLWWVLELVAPGPWVFTVVQIGTLFAAAAVLVRQVRPPGWLVLGFFFWLLLWPAMFALEGALQKDMLGGNLLLLGFSVLAGRSRRGSAVFVAFACCAFAAMLRYQYAIGLVGLAVVAWRAPGRIVGIGMLATLGVAFLVTVAITLVFRQAGAGNVEASLRKIAIFDIAGTIAHRPDLQLPALVGAGVDDGALHGRVRLLYDADRVDTLWVPGGLFALLAPVPDPVLYRAWWEAVVGKPGGFLAHRIESFRRFLAVATPGTCWPIYAGIAPAEARDPQFTAGLVASVPRPLSFPVLRWRWFPANSIAFRPWFYVALNTVVVLLGCLRRAPLLVVALAGTALVYELSFLLLPQACDFRYSYMSMVAAAFAAVATLASARAAS